MKNIILVISIIFILIGCKDSSLVYKILNKQLELGKDTIQLKNKFPFKWDKLIIASDRSLIDKELGFEYPYLAISNDIEGLPIGRSIIFLKDGKIIYHEDTKYKYSGFDIKGGRFNFEIIGASDDNLYIISATSAIYKLEVEEQDTRGRVIVLYPYGVDVKIPGMLGSR